jgi:hypothetical protein
MEEITAKVKELFSPGLDITTDSYHNKNRQFLLALMDSDTFESISISKFADSSFGKYGLFLESRKSMKGFLENKSFIFFDGDIMTTYNKSTYFREQDNALYDYVYVFGDGRDKQYCKDDTVYSCISTQICRDLVAGIRSKDTENRRFHILESNTIDFDGRSIPRETTYVIHANYGKPGAIYKKTRRFSSNPEDEKYVWDQIGPFKFYFKFTIGTSYYTLQGININPEG